MDVAVELKRKRGEEIFDGLVEVRETQASLEVPLPSTCSGRGSWNSNAACRS